MLFILFVKILHEIWSLMNIFQKHENKLFSKSFPQELETKTLFGFLLIM
jgi:hypothetical protein